MTRRRKKIPRPAIESRPPVRPPVGALPVGYPFVTCRPVCPGCSPCAGHYCRPVTTGTCQPGTLFYPTTCLPSTACLPSVPPGCVPRPCTPV